MSDKWAALGAAAESGHLLLERGVVQDCARHCSELIEKLVAIRERAGMLGDLKGMGTFPSGIALAKKFSLKAVGGDYSMVQALTDHIAEVEAMREVFLRIEARYQAAEAGGVAKLAAVDAELDGNR